MNIAAEAREIFVFMQIIHENISISIFYGLLDKIEPCKIR